MLVVVFLRTSRIMHAMLQDTYALLGDTCSLINLLSLAK